MKVARVRRSFHFVPVTFFVIAIFFLFLWASIKHHDASAPQSPRLRRLLLRKLMEYDHHFIPANNPSFEYFGRWVPTLNQLRRDASFPGSYTEFDVTNTTSLYVSLRNVREDLILSEQPQKIDARQMFIQPAEENIQPSAAVSLLIEIDQGTGFYFNQTGHDMLAVSSSLDSSCSYKVRLTYLNPGEGTGTLEFQGVWVDKGGHLVLDHTYPTTNNILEGQYSAANPVNPPGKHFEVVTSLAYEDPVEVNYWPQRLASEFNIHHTIFPTLSNCLTLTCPSSKTSISDLYFRASPAGTAHFSVPYRFGPHYPSALILDVGILDYHTLLLGNPSPSTIKQFTNTFVQHYTAFVSTVRATAYPYHSPYLTQQYDTLAIDASFTYNSAPSILPIFLMTPLTPSKRLRRLLSHAISEAVNNLQAQGDKSTFWIDTSGWLTDRDFMQSAAVHEQEQAPDNQDTQPIILPSLPSLTRKAHHKITTYLSHHLCPYLSTSIKTSPQAPTSNATPNGIFTTSSPADTSAQPPCPFNKHDNYLGHLYVPAEAGMGKMLEERKIELVKRFLGMEDILA